MIKNENERYFAKILSKMIEIISVVVVFDGERGTETADKLSVVRNKNRNLFGFC